MQLTWFGHSAFRIDLTGAVIPCHYETFPALHGTAEKFKAEMEGAATKVLVPKRGVAVSL